MAADDNEPPSLPSPTAAKATMFVADRKLYGHLDNLKDACTGRRINSGTELVHVTDCGKLLKDLTGEMDPAVPCQMKLDDGRFAPDFNYHAGGHQLHVTYNDLSFVPGVRISYELKNTAGHLYTTLVVDCHFNRSPETGPGIYDYHCTPSGSMSFVVYGAACSGCNKLDRTQHRPDGYDHRIIDKLESLISPDKPVQLMLQLSYRRVRIGDLHNIRDVQARVSGETVDLLPSIKAGVDYAAFGNDPDRLAIPVLQYKEEGGILHRMLLVQQLISGQNRHLMVPQKAEHTFPTVKAAIVELVYSQVAAEAQREAHRLCDIVGRLLDHHPSLPHYAAIFRIVSDPHRSFANAARQLKHLARPEFDVTFTPHYNSFTFSGQLETARQLQDSKRWRAMLLNQRHADIPYVDTTAASRIPSDDQERHFQSLRTCKPWNLEGLDIIDSLKHVKGGLHLIMGPAATGKSMLNRALSLYFWCLGYHVLSISPANSKCDAVASGLTPAQLYAEFPDWNLSKFEFLRLFPSSRDIGVSKLSRKQAANTSVGHKGGEVLSFQEFLIALDEREQVQGTVKQYGVLQAMIVAAEMRRLAKMMRQKIGEADVDAWACLSELIDEHRQHAIKASDVAAHQRKKQDSDEETPVDWSHYEEAYRACKDHIISQSRYMITTSGNIHSKELIKNWYADADDGTKRVGVVILIDEAPKDQEINVWAGILCPRWAHAVRGVFLFGDEKQIGPTNTSTRQLNPYWDRLNLSLPLRLIREGYLVFRLREQYSIHAALADFPGQEIYDGNMRSADGMNKSLEVVKPGFREALLNIITREGQFELKASDHDLRLHWIQVYGSLVVQGNSRGSPSHVKVFFENIFPKLYDYFSSRGEKLSENVTIVCPYRCAKTLYQTKINELTAFPSQFTVDDMPRLETVDGGQGHSSFMAILDATFPDGDHLGFMTPARVNIAVTRATDVFWVLGGSLLCDREENKQSPLVKYRREMSKAGRVHALQEDAVGREL